MSTRSQVIIIFLVVLATAVPFGLSAIDQGLVGGYQPINDLNAPEVQDAAEFAVKEFNNEIDLLKSNRLLQYHKILKGEYQVVNGIKYKMVISANDDKSDQLYQALVYSNPREKINQLLSFKKVKVRM